MADPLLTTMQLGRLLQSARKASKLTQALVGARMGLSQKRISALELDPGSLTVEQLLKLCAVLGLEITIGSKHAQGLPPSPRPARVEW
jgi:HTH-type transcriptional regulator / antitoxin HipB